MPSRRRSPSPSPATLILLAVLFAVVIIGPLVALNLHH